ncbi:MAG: RAMP superfamily CRISPR-associated protein [Acidimicrobiales bacterium]
MIKRLVVTGMVRLDGPAAVGSGEYSRRTDRPVASGPDGRPRLPATAIAGVLRSELARLAPDLSIQGVGAQSVLDDLMGHAHDKPGTGSDWHRSRLRVHEPVLITGAGSTVRDGVGIDRATGSAKQDIKYDYEVSDAGTAFSLTLELDLDGDGARRAELLLRIAVDQWAAGRLAVGGRCATGLGAMTFEPAGAREIDLAEASQLTAWLRARPRQEDDRTDIGVPHDLVDPQPGEIGVARAASADGTWPGWFRATTRLVNHGTMLVAGSAPVPALRHDQDPDPLDPASSDAQPLVTRHVDGSRPYVVPGSSLRGVLRSRAEQIVRTLGQVSSACDPLDGRKDSPTYACARRKLRWEDDDANSAEPPEDMTEPERARRIREEASCPVCRLFGNTRLGGRVRVEESLVENARLEKIDHVAVDRFTGGAVDARKFDTAALRGGQFTLGVTIDRPAGWEAALLLLLLRDLCEGWVPVGSRTARGYGDVSGWVSGLEFASLGTGPLADVTAGGTEGGIWKLNSQTFEPSPHFLGVDAPWDRLDDHGGLAQLVRTGLDELARASARWQPASTDEDHGDD